MPNNLWSSQGQPVRCMLPAHLVEAVQYYHTDIGLYESSVVQWTPGWAVVHLTNGLHFDQFPGLEQLSDPTCFSTYESFKKELKLAFEPPKNAFRLRAEFLDLQQGTQDVHAYAPRARYLVSNVVTKSIDETTKVVTFVKGLKDGPVKTYLFREYPSTLEAAITLAMQ
ncbi:hypothetical protein PHMEG_00017895 [Phytophthora megakarya]|uniref:Retrotransposon gag domain-containing protein n=1 Tax=Phytophthora megakarya TaxID=4795 RepID=A0A225VW56_9STRA|nr:hypothetical protein PHMEG_00017895 [Phytophthora megakarya]